MKETWKLPDIIDLEYFMLEDARLENSNGVDALSERDREIFLRKCKSEVEDGAGEAGGNRPEYNSRSLLMCWLFAMRERFLRTGSGILPGTLWNEVYHLSAIGAVIFGLVSGAGLALSLLVYSGTRPVNVSTYLFFLVFSQIFIVSLTVSIILIQKRARGRKLRHPALMLVYRLFSAFSKAVSSRISASSWQNLQAATGSFMARRKIYGAIPILPFFILVQIFASGFNAGALAATIGKVTFSDLAFGWQTTLDITPETAAAIVSFLSAPWSWCMPSSVPSPSEIAGSRIILKDGIYRLATGDLVSWWPFLCMSVLVYGLIPRLALLFYSRFSLERALSRLSFEAGCFKKITMRMLRERITTCGDSEDGEALRHGEHVGIRAEKTFFSEQKQSDSAVIMLVPEDLSEASDALKVLAEGAGIEVSELLVIDEECDIEEEPCGERLRSLLSEKSVPVMVVREAWLPPLREVLQFISKIRHVGGDKFPITIALCGRMDAYSRFGSVSAADLNIWKRQMVSLGDPYVHLIPLGTGP